MGLLSILYLEVVNENKFMIDFRWDFKLMDAGLEEKIWVSLKD